jgi:fused signal recognition particle receptor
MPTPQPNEPIQIPEPDIIRPPTPAEAPQPDVPAGLPEPGPDIVHPTPPSEIPPARPQEVPSESVELDRELEDADMSNAL